MSGTKWAATFAIFLCTGVTSVTCDHGLHAKLSSVKRQGQDAGDNPIASQVAEALAKGLEESLKDCKIDPERPDESLRQCMKEKDAEKAKLFQEGLDQPDTSKHYKLLKTALLNLNEQMRETDTFSEEGVAELLNKLDSVVKLLDAKTEDLPEVKTSTLVEVPTEKEIEEAVVMQDYEHHHVDFWDTLFSLSDKVALGLLLTIKAVPRDEARDHLKKFLRGSDEERLKILEETLNLQRNNFQSDIDRVAEELAEKAAGAGEEGEREVEDNRKLRPAERLEVSAKRQSKEEEALSKKNLLASRHTHRSMDAFTPLGQTPSESLAQHAHVVEPAGQPSSRDDPEETNKSFEVSLGFACSLVALVLVGLGLYFVRSKFVAKRNPAPGYKRIYSKRN